MANKFSAESLEILKLLVRSKNVLIAGPPGTGKSRVLSEVAAAFVASAGTTVTTGPPQLNPQGGIPIPPSTGNSPTNIPAPSKTNRKVFRTAFHQNSKYREFVTGMTPSISQGAAGSSFTVSTGPLYNASEFAKASDSTALIIIDEINRGPAVQIFGGSIVAIEPDKRLAANGSTRMETQFFELLDPATGATVEYALPNELYILAAMNQADASVEPLDVAFLRRWEPFKLLPSENVLRTHYGLGITNTTSLPPTTLSEAVVLEASVRAWLAVNKNITLGRGPEFQVGHGVLMSDSSISTLPINDLLDSICVGWRKILTHVEEVFFGDHRGMAATINALAGPSHNPFELKEITFADDLRYKLDGPDNLSRNNIYNCLRAFARE